MHQHQSGSIINVSSIAAVAAATDPAAYKVSKEGGCGGNARVSEPTEAHVDKNGSGEEEKRRRFRRSDRRINLRLILARLQIFDDSDCHLPIGDFTYRLEKAFPRRRVPWRGCKTCRTIWCNRTMDREPGPHTGSYDVRPLIRSSTSASALKPGRS